ncbi:hypothetical protein TWF225_005973, partial [Orbilia oligospora]
MRPTRRAIFLPSRSLDLSNFVLQLTYLRAFKNPSSSSDIFITSAKIDLWPYRPRFSLYPNWTGWTSYFGNYIDNYSCRISQLYFRALLSQEGNERPVLSLNCLYRDLEFCRISRCPSAPAFKAAPTNAKPLRVVFIVSHSDYHDTLSCL